MFFAHPVVHLIYNFLRSLPNFRHDTFLRIFIPSCVFQTLQLRRPCYKLFVFRRQKKGGNNKLRGGAVTWLTHTFLLRTLCSLGTLNTLILCSPEHFTPQHILLRLKDISSPDFSTSCFNPRPFDPRFFKP